MDKDTTPSINGEQIDLLATIWAFLVKNALGIMSVIFGVTAKVYIIRRQARRVTRNQCLLAVFMAGMAGMIGWYLVSALKLENYWKAIICGYLPIISETVTLRIILWIDPIVDSIGKALKKNINKE